MEPEQLDHDTSAYAMLHTVRTVSVSFDGPEPTSFSLQAQTGAPCLSFDILKDTLGMVTRC